MSRAPAWIPELHDHVLRRWHGQWNLLDYEIAARMGFAPSTVRKHRLRLGLPDNTRQKSSQNPDKAPPPPKEKPNPIAVARQWLGSRMTEDEKGFWLDGRPSSLHELMIATNKMRKNYGAEQITVCERWRV